MMKHSQDIDIARRTIRFHDTTSPKPRRLSLSIGRRTEDCVEGRKEEEGRWISRIEPEIVGLNYRRTTEFHG